MKLRIVRNRLPINGSRPFAPLALFVQHSKGGRADPDNQKLQTRGARQSSAAAFPSPARGVRICDAGLQSTGRVVAGFAPGGGHEGLSYSYSMPLARERFWEGVDVIVQAWTQPGPKATSAPQVAWSFGRPGRNRSSA
ncbi:MAG: hypothetical protein JWM36_3880 [Hyphomicrobiales bacterium]|nr:hypothetical protein [Hyphomicrobiales bacterium]